MISFFDVVISYKVIYMNKARRVKDSYTIMTQLVLPKDTNTMRTLYGGKLVDWIDIVGSTVAMRHSRHRVVTASIDRLDFYSPIHLGDIVILEAWINFVGNTSMEVEVRVTKENPLTGEQKHTCTAYLTYVALDENGKPTRVPRLILETEEEKRRWKEAEERRKLRLMAKK